MIGKISEQQEPSSCEGSSVYSFDHRRIQTSVLFVSVAGEFPQFIAPDYSIFPTLNPDNLWKTLVDKNF